MQTWVIRNNFRWGKRFKAFFPHCLIQHSVETNVKETAFQKNNFYPALKTRFTRLKGNASCYPTAAPDALCQVRQQPGVQTRSDHLGFAARVNGTFYISRALTHHLFSGVGIDITHTWAGKASLSYSFRQCQE